MGKFPRRASAEFSYPQYLRSAAEKSFYQSSFENPICTGYH